VGEGVFLCGQPLLILRGPQVTLFNHLCLSVCLFVGHILVLYLNQCIFRQTFPTIWQGHHPSFFSPTAGTKFQGNPSLGAIKTLEWENVATFYRNRRLSSVTLKGGERGVKFLWRIS